MSRTPSKATASEQVLGFLRREYRIEQLPPGTRLPTAREVSAQLKVSEGTVKNVYRQLAREERVRSKSGSGSFWIGQRTSVGSPRIGIDLFPTPESTTRWGYRLYGGLLKAQLSSSETVQLHSFRPEEAGNASHYDGVLLFSTLHRQSPAIEELTRNRPYISFNPLRDELLENFVAPDYFGVSRRLGEAWRTSGRRRVLAILSPGLDRSCSIRQRYSGLLCGLEIGGNAIEVRQIVSPGASEAEGYDTLRRFLRKTTWRPDAVYGVGDGLAHGAIRALREAGLHLPEEVSVVGGHGAEPPGNGCFLTCMEHSLESIGEEMLGLLLHRIRHNGLSLPGRVMPTPFIIGNTTTEAENRLLQPNPAAVPPSEAPHAP